MSYPLSGPTYTYEYDTMQRPWKMKEGSTEIAMAVAGVAAYRARRESTEAPGTRTLETSPWWRAGNFEAVTRR